MTKFSGTKSTMKSETLVAHVKDKYELDLQVDDGNVVILSVAPSAGSPEMGAGTEGE